ncbi:MAG: prolyl-tRNA synthetase associated domain-containing protein [Bacteroidales bacterium]|nr:prolyl-tRNA synthetase associated domain-containing protein [Bacteroidales bacterium]
MTGRTAVINYLEQHHIPFEIYEHPPVPTVEEALPYWKDIDSAHCKNLFFRNHKGNRHYLVILDHRRQLNIRDLEQKLKQGKISFASPKRMERYLGLSGGAVSAFGIINDHENHVHLFIDAALQSAERISFHPNENNATLVISFASFKRFLESSGNSYEFIALYETRS